MLIFELASKLVDMWADGFVVLIDEGGEGMPCNTHRMERQPWGLRNRIVSTAVEDWALSPSLHSSWSLPCDQRGEGIEFRDCGTCTHYITHHTSSLDETRDKRCCMLWPAWMG